MSEWYITYDYEDNPEVGTLHIPDKDHAWDFTCANGKQDIMEHIVKCVNSHDDLLNACEETGWNKRKETRDE